MTEVVVATTQDELSAVERLRYQVYTAEMNLYRDVADAERQRLVDEHDATGIQLLGLVDGVPVGTVRLHVGLPAAWQEDLDAAVFADDVPPERMSFGSRFTVLPEHRGTPIVLKLIEACVAQSLERGCDLLLLDCVPHLLNLYQTLGWRRYTRKTLKDPHTGVLVPMALVLRDRDHLARMRSPFLAVLDRMEPGATTPAWAGRYFDPSPFQVPAGWDGWLDLHRAATATHGLFAGLSEADTAAVLGKSQVLELAPEHWFVVQGTVYRSLFVVLDGSVEILAGDVPVRLLGRGELLGEVAWLLNSERSANARAGAAGARILALHDGTLQRVMAEQPTVGLALMRNVARTLAARLISVSSLQPDPRAS